VRLFAEGRTVSGIDLEPIRKAIAGNVEKNGRTHGADQLVAALDELEAWRRLFTKLDEALDVYALCRTTDRMRSELRRMVPPEST
jgi:hypothetical protein